MEGIKLKNIKMPMVLAFILILTIILIGCTQLNTGEQTIISIPINVNEPNNAYLVNNILNSSNITHFIKVGETVYYSKQDSNSNNFYLIARQNDIEEKLVQTMFLADGLNYFNNNLLFVDGFRLYIFDLSTGNKQYLANVLFDAHSLMIVDNAAYFLNSYSELIEFDLVNGIKKQIANEVLFNFAINSGVVVYKTRCIYTGTPEIRWRLLNSLNESELVVEAAASQITFHNGYIYYLNFASTFTDQSSNMIYRIDRNGVSTRVSEQRTRRYNISGEWIYYSNMDNWHLYRMRLDGTENEKIAEIEVSGIWFYGNELFFLRRAILDIYQINLNTMDISRVNWWD